jgi:hypothetical protein
LLIADRPSMSSSRAPACWLGFSVEAHTILPLGYSYLLLKKSW